MKESAVCLGLAFYVLGPACFETGDVIHASILLLSARSLEFHGGCLLVRGLAGCWCGAWMLGLAFYLMWLLFVQDQYTWLGRRESEAAIAW